jgi:hypothetical protein
VSLYDSYLTPRYTLNGDFKQPRGTYLLDCDNNPLKFYKMKRAKAVGDSVLASNGGIKIIFRDDSEGYMGISRSVNSDGDCMILQEPISLEKMSFDGKKLPDFVQHKISSSKNQELTYFDYLYKYRIVSPVEIFAASDDENITVLKGERLNSIFSEDFKTVLNDDELDDIASDKFIKLLDSAIYCDVDGDSKKVKVDHLRYEFLHPKFPDVRVVVSRYKVLRLCKLLKENASWINDNSSNVDIENTLLAVIVKDSIVSEVELMMLRLAVKNILFNGIIKVPEIGVDKVKVRGVK